MKPKKITLSVAVPAYNEQASITGLLSQLVSQKLSRFKLAGITVFSDRSTDDTHALVRKFAVRHPLVRLVIGQKRLGKYLRLNHIFSACRSDVLIVLDADISLVGHNFLEKLASAVYFDSRALMVSAHQIMVRPSGFISRVVYTNFLLWDYVRWSIPGFATGNNFYASAIGFRGAYVRGLRIPVNLLDPHLFLYYAAAVKGGTRYTTSARILQQPISTLSDYRRFLRRPLGKRDLNLENIYGTSIYQSYRVALRYKLIGIFKCFWHEPLFTPLALVLGLYGKYYLKSTSLKNNSSLWEIVTSTKKVFNYEKC